MQSNRPLAQFTIGIDLMGGDIPPILLLEDILPSLPTTASFVFFLSHEVQEAVSTFPEHVKVVTAAEVISMKDHPLIASRQKMDSSIALGLKALHDGEIDAFITHGNTGALTTLASKLLLPLPKILRPALATMIPTKKDPAVLIDVGANVSSTPDHLLQFALMGAAYQKSHNHPMPRLGILNIGKEEGKGRKELYGLLKKIKTHLLYAKTKPFSFVGNVESHDIFEGEVDVVVSDGFTGNLFLKTAEAAVDFITKLLPGQTTPLSSLRSFRGAILAGIEGLVIKCHGNSHSGNFIEAIEEAKCLLNQNFLEKIKSSL